MTVNEQELAMPAASVAMNVTSCEPTSASVGVQENMLLTGLPLVGNEGVSTAPSGTPDASSVTVSPASVSEARTVKVNGFPTLTITLELQAGMSKTGAVQVFSRIVTFPTK